MKGNKLDQLTTQRLFHAAKVEKIAHGLGGV
jgi:hypothetical protein